MKIVHHPVTSSAYAQTILNPKYELEKSYRNNQLYAPIFTTGFHSQE
jgi:hypothetical protein